LLRSSIRAMAKAVDAQLEEIRQIRSDPASPEATAVLAKALKSKTGLVVATAAGVIEEARLSAFEPALGEAFRRFMDLPDKTCLAKTAIAKALVALDSSDDDLWLLATNDDDLWLLAIRHVQPEPAWGGTVDAAVELRCAASAGLANSNARKAIEPLVRLLADKEAPARAAAARALGGCGSETSAALLQYKLLIGDDDLRVLSDCFAGVLELTRSAEYVEPYLDSPDDAAREAAILSIGEWRCADGFAILRRRWDIDLRNRKVLALAMALSRQAAAIDFLVSQLTEVPEPTAAGIVEALAIYKSDDGLRNRVRRAAGKRGGEVLAAFDDHFTA
jgi:HEAT repeat protein